MSANSVLILVLVHESLFIIKFESILVSGSYLFPILFGSLTSTINSVFGNGGTAIVHGFLPSQVHMVHTPIGQFDLLWGSGGSPGVFGLDRLVRLQRLRLALLVDSSDPEFKEFCKTFCFVFTFDILAFCQH